ncbi:hypothetical protein BDQ12DRAFT_689698 [Crucibulum laeve]|uniref:DyP dimeric alpha+beta barrel domain-containing protein n=1 Tax=Crucibulum laeve TaxID=68775 RepID=A0A5C3LNK8_9AGAR|nr:hypothetical protein BDQ12DRAFT_689698 [Crucibulum laeve]
MSRPTIAANGANVKVVLPPGWYATVSAITRKPYNQLLTCEYEVQGDTKNNFVANKWNQPNQTMRDIDTTDDVIGIIPQNDPVDINIKFYYSKTGSIREDALADDKYKSNKVDILTSVKPPNAPKDFPDYTTFIVLVEDAPDGEQLAGKPQYDDFVCTINCLRGIKIVPIPVGPSYNLPNIQGDILPALPKALEYFYYFRITNLDHFRKVFKEFILPKINTADELVNRPPPPVNPNDPKSFEYPFLGVNVGFSNLGLKKFGLAGESLGDDPFVKGQQQDSRFLGDAGTLRGDFWTPDWDAEFKVDIDGIFLIVAYNEKIAQDFIKDMEAKFLYTASRSAIKKIYSLHGFPRAGAEARNDHFGYRGGMSNPQVKGVTYKDKMRYPGAPEIPLGTIIIGYDGDADKDKRPAWAKDGAFMVTRKLNNLVPEFDDFLLLHGPKIFPDIAPQAAALRLGARLFGRWKNGTSVEMSPDNDDPSIANDDNRINNFTFDQNAKQSRCPFASHMRKSNPRNDVSPIESAFKHFVRRHNMPYGSEVTPEERDGNGTIQERGLHVVCYQSSIVRGFKFIQEGWYNDPNFPPNKPVVPGMDPIFGQTGKEDQAVYRTMSGANPTTEQELMTFPHKFIDPRGGEYFFNPSISTMKQYIAAQ